MPQTLTWHDVQDIAIALHEKFPGQDPLEIRFTDLHKWVRELPGFDDDPNKSKPLDYFPPRNDFERREKDRAVGIGAALVSALAVSIRNRVNTGWSRTSSEKKWSVAASEGGKYSVVSASARPEPAYCSALP